MTFPKTCGTCIKIMRQVRISSDKKTKSQNYRCIESGNLVNPKFLAKNCPLRKDVHNGTGNPPQSGKTLFMAVPGR